MTSGRPRVPLRRTAASPARATAPSCWHPRPPITQHCRVGRGAAARPAIGSVLLAARAEATTCSSRRQSRTEAPSGAGLAIRPNSRRRSVRSSFPRETLARWRSGPRLRPPMRCGERSATATGGANRTPRIRAHSPCRSVKDRGSVLFRCVSGIAGVRPRRAGRLVLAANASVAASQRRLRCLRRQTFVVRLVLSSRLSTQHLSVGVADLR